jgi:hypothetical protein
LVHLATSVKAQVHACWKNGIVVTVSDLFGVAGFDQLRSQQRPDVFRARIDSQLSTQAASNREQPPPAHAARLITCVCGSSVKRTRLHVP